MDVFTAASHDDVLQLVVQIALLLATARLLGGLAQIFNQPSVLGEILAGVIPGPSFPSGVFPPLGELIVPRSTVQGNLLILGTGVRVGTTRLHLGPRVERLVREAGCPVVVVSS